MNNPFDDNNIRPPDQVKIDKLIDHQHFIVFQFKGK